MQEELSCFVPGRISLSSLLLRVLSCSHGWARGRGSARVPVSLLVLGLSGFHVQLWPVFCFLFSFPNIILEMTTPSVLLSFCKLQLPFIEWYHLPVHEIKGLILRGYHLQVWKNRSRRWSWKRGAERAGWGTHLGEVSGPWAPAEAFQSCRCSEIWKNWVCTFFCQREMCTCTSISSCHQTSCVPQLSRYGTEGPAASQGPAGRAAPRRGEEGAVSLRPPESRRHLTSGKWSSWVTSFISTTSFF